jgi:hypothetical protein
MQLRNQKLALGIFGFVVAFWTFIGGWMLLDPGVVERVDPLSMRQHLFYSRSLDSHVHRYQFAKTLLEKQKARSVADIASGACYGMKILREAVAVVDGYDKLCDNYVVNLDIDSWGKKYDAIVSFETIEHLERPEFFLSNVAQSAPVLILSAPVNEASTKNHFHKQHWSTRELQELLERYFRCEYYHYTPQGYQNGLDASSTNLFAVCKNPT